MGTNAPQWEKFAAEDESARVRTCLETVLTTKSFPECWYAIADGLTGYAGVEDTHRHTNPMGSACDMACPTLVINARDDPVCTMAPLYLPPHPLFASGPHALVLTRRGSHCCYLEPGMFARRVTWANRVCLDFLCAALHDTESELTETEGAPGAAVAAK